jgi:hypothetical protein
MGTLGNRFGDKKLPSRFFIFGIGQNKSGGRGYGVCMGYVWGVWEMFLRGKWGKAALPIYSTHVNPKNTVPSKIFKDSCPTACPNNTPKTTDLP